MSTPRFYCPPPLPSRGLFELPAPVAHHANRVLRLRVHDAVQLFDGTGQELHGTIQEISGKRVMLENLHTSTVNRESPLRLVLAQAVCRSEKMDWVVQNATELGVAEIQPVQTQRSVARLSADRAQKRAEHWHGVAIAACEQCGRNILPEISMPQEFSAWLASMRTKPGAKFILLPHGATALHTQPPPATITLLIGPEGGFSEEEAQLAQQVGFLPIRLGPRVLRTETAALAGLVAVQTWWGDFK